MVYRSSYKHNRKIFIVAWITFIYVWQRFERYFSHHRANENTKVFDIRIFLAEDKIRYLKVTELPSYLINFHLLIGKKDVFRFYFLTFLYFGEREEKLR